MSTSQIFAAVDNLVAIATGLFDASTVSVFDGPISAQPSTQDFLIVGADSNPPPTTVVAAVSGSSDWIGLGALHRDELFTINCLYVAFSKDPTFTVMRARAKANIGLIESALRSNTGTGFSLNGALNQPGWSAVEITQVNQVNDGDGGQVHIGFGVVCRGRI